MLNLLLLWVLSSAGAVAFGLAFACFLDWMADDTRKAPRVIRWPLYALLFVALLPAIIPLVIWARVR